MDIGKKLKLKLYKSVAPVESHDMISFFKSVRYQLTDKKIYAQTFTFVILVTTECLL